MIERYSFGKIVAKGVAYTHDIKIIHGTVIPEWWRKSGHQVGVDDVKDLLESRAGILVFGTGTYGRLKLTSTLRAHLEKSGIAWIEKNTPEAVKIFNRLFEEGKQVSAGFHLTC